MSDINQTLGQLLRTAYKKAWRAGPEDEKTKRIVEVLKRAVADIEVV